MPAGCPPESNPYPYPYPYPDSNPKFESGSVTNPYPIQAPGACAEERPRAGEQSLRHSLRCDTSLYSREAIDGAIPEDGVRPLAGESPRPASALPSEGAQEAPREDGQSLRCGCAAPKGSPWHQGELSAKLTEGFFDPSVTAYAVPPFLSSAWSPLCAHGTRLRCSLLHWAYFALFRPQGARFVRPFSLREKGGFWTAQLPAIVPLPKRLPCVRGTKEAAQPVAAIAADESSEARRAASELANDAD